MKKFLMFLLTLALIVSGVAFTLGFRVHPEALQKNLSINDRQFRQIHLNSGKTFVGEVLKETEDAIKITFENGAVTFSKNEIRSMEPINPKEAEFGDYADEFVALQPKPFFTFRREDSLFYKPPRTAGAWAAAAAAAEKSKKGPGAGKVKNKDGESEEGSEDPQMEKIGKIMEMVQKSQELADQKRAEQEEAIKKMQEGG